MEKLDRLGWAAGLSFRSYGLRLGIRVTQPEVLETLRDFLPPGWKQSASPIVDHLYSLRVGGSGARPGMRQFHLLYAGPGRVARTLDLDELFERLESNLQLLVAALAPRRVFVHAGVVGWRGQAIVLPGRSMCGKSTLVAALVRAGATYYSDEYAVFDDQGRVHPYPRQLSLRETEGERSRRLSAQALGGRIGVRPLPVGLIVASEYQSGARWRPRNLSPGRALLVLLSNTVPARIRPELAFTTARQVACQAPTLNGRRGEAEEMVVSLLDRLSAREIAL